MWFIANHSTLRVCSIPVHGGVCSHRCRPCRPRKLHKWPSCIMYPQGFLLLFQRGSRWLSTVFWALQKHLVDWEESKASKYEFVQNISQNDNKILWAQPFAKWIQQAYMLLCVVNNVHENPTWAAKKKKEQLSCLNTVCEKYSHQCTKIIVCMLYVSSLVNLIIASTLHLVTT